MCVSKEEINNKKKKKMECRDDRENIGQFSKAVYRDI